MFKKVAKRENLVIIGMTDASYKCDDCSIGGELIMMGTSLKTTVVPIYWKSVTIKKVCHSAKAVETRSMVSLLSNVQCFRDQVEQLLFGESKQRIPIKLFTDSKPMLESIGSTHQIGEKILRQSIQDMKDVLETGQVASFSWLDGDVNMVADVLTKECRWNPFLDVIMVENNFPPVFTKDNIVMSVEGEVKMMNKRNKFMENNGSSAEPMTG